MTNYLLSRQSRSTAALTIAIPVLLYASALSYNLQYFYIRGASVYDAGWFAWLSKNAFQFPMPNPALIGGNFLAIHVSPIFFLTSCLGGMLPPLPYPVWFSLWFSTWLPCGFRRKSAGYSDLISATVPI